MILITMLCRIYQEPREQIVIRACRNNVSMMSNVYPKTCVFTKCPLIDVN